MSATVLAVQKQLRTLGWRNVKADGEAGPVTTAAIADFQRAWNLGPALTIDGRVGPATRAALAESVKAGGKASPSFRFVEMRCKCGDDGRPFPGCRQIRAHRALFRGLEAYRASVGTGVAIVSGYRCPRRNQEVGGASSSQHVYGAAADVTAVQSASAVQRLRRFAGIGKQGSTGKVRHVDVRHVSGNNTTGGTPDRPTVWTYAS